VCFLQKYIQKMWQTIDEELAAVGLAVAGQHAKCRRLASTCIPGEISPRV
jgi:hypothetical protein